MARLKQNFWDLAISDCTDCLKLSPDSFKAHYYMAQAKVEERFDLDGALSHATRAHQLCAASNDRSLGKVTELVLRCKKERWEDHERRREREHGRLEAELLALLERERDGELAALRADGDGGEDDPTRRMVADDYAAKARLVADVFERSRSATAKRRAVPDWAIDDIGFGFMVDPVIVSSGLCSSRLQVSLHMPKTVVANNVLTKNPSRQKPASRTNARPSWNTSADTPPTP